MVVIGGEVDIKVVNAMLYVGTQHSSRIIAALVTKHWGLKWNFIQSDHIKFDFPLRNNAVIDNMSAYEPSGPSVPELVRVSVA